MLIQTNIKDSKFTRHDSAIFGGRINMLTRPCGCTFLLSGTLDLIDFERGNSNCGLCPKWESVQVFLPIGVERRPDNVLMSAALAFINLHPRSAFSLNN